MTEAASPLTPRLWTPAGFREDEWIRAGSAEALDAAPRAILPAGALMALAAEARRAANGRLGVALAAGEPLTEIVPLLPELALAALDFPAFNDGRSYSKAELLRGRHGFRGVLRATGDVLIDQIPLMLRLGFTEFEVRNPTTLKRLHAGHLTGIALHYQPAGGGSAEPATYAWRRRSAA